MKKYQALYRENRPEIFSEILGQDHIVKVLKHQIESGTVSHAYLFCGTRGTGKTTTARILAKGINCTSEGTEKPCGECANCKAISSGTYLDVIEIDAASNNGVDNVRELRESVNFPPAIGKKKIYIIDEVHMLSTEASNALLKTLEEPPEHVIFILATTDPERLPQTILSRCMRMDFRRVTGSLLKQNMREICCRHDAEITEEALALLASNADGSVRDSLSLLEQCLSSGEKHIDRDIVLDYLGTMSADFYLELTDHVLNHNVSAGLLMLDKALAEGKDVKQMMKDWMAHYRSLLITKYVREPEDMLNMSMENIAQIREQSNRIELSQINHSIVTLAKTINDARYSTQSRILMEVVIVTLAEEIGYGMERREINYAKSKPAQASKSQENLGLRVSDAKPAPAKAEVTETLLKEKAEAIEHSLKKKAEVIETPLKAKVVESDDDVKDRFDTEDCETKPDNSTKNKDSLDEEDLTEIWEEVCKEAAHQKPSMAVLHNTSLLGLNDKEFKVLVSGNFFKMKIEKEKELISKIMEEKTGKRRIMVIRDEDRSKEEIEDERLSKAIKEASEVLGRPVNLRR